MNNVVQNVIQQDIFSLPKSEDIFNISIDYGDKVINFRKWKGKERRLVNELLTSSMNENEINDILTYGCMQEVFYLSDDEKIYTMYILKKHSMTDVFLLNYVCDKCKTVNVEVVSFSDILEPKLNNFSNISNISVESIEIEFGNISNNAFTIDTIKKQLTTFDRNFYEMALRIKSIKIDNNIFTTFSLEEIVYFLDNLDSNIFDEIYTLYKEQKFSLTPSIECTCTESTCNNVTKLHIDTIPNFVEEWTIV